MRVGSLGDVIFEVSSHRVSTLGGMNMSRDARYEDHEVQGAFPRSEFLAPGLGSCSLSMVLRRDLGCDPAAEAEQLEEKLIRGEVLRLIIVGKNLGKWTLRKIDQSWRHMLPGGTGPAILTLNVELKEYF
ncbi:MAG: phage tail protein [Desulfovibrio sp.]|nr:phage tail protein [Desulfovibrio sp.]